MKPEQSVQPRAEQAAELQSLDAEEAAGVAEVVAGVAEGVAAAEAVEEVSEVAAAARVVADSSLCSSGRWYRSLKPRKQVADHSRLFQTHTRVLIPRNPQTVVMTTPRNTYRRGRAISL